MTARTRAPLPVAADLYGDIEPIPKVRWNHYVPGLIITVLAALSAAYLAEHYGAPFTLMALLVGLSLNFLSADARLAPGLAFASRMLMQIGIVLIGARVTLAQISGLGLASFAAIIAIVGTTMGASVLIARRLGYSAAFGALAGGAVAICGASAAMALAAVLGERRVDQTQLALVLVGISAMSAAAMVLYPVLCHHFGFGDLQAGFVLGAAIHDVAQSIGAGYSFSPAAGQDAVIVKLTRVALLAPVLALIGYLDPLEGKAKRAFGMPWFVAGFFLLAGINSTGVIPVAVGQAATNFASALLACAVTATGIRSPMQKLLESGPRQLLIIFFASLIALILACATAFFLLR